jgi:hypothetical protein
MILAGTTWVGAPERMGLHTLGMHLGLGRPGPSPDHLLFGRHFSFFGLLAFWFESLFWGLGDRFPSSHILFRLKMGN